MAHIIELPVHHDPRGSLTVLEKVLPFSIKRVFWIDKLQEDLVRGGHRHHETFQAMICLQGQTEVSVKKYGKTENFLLNRPNTVLILEPEDWHEMKDFKHHPILLVMASHEYDAKDYVYEALS